VLFSVFEVFGQRPLGQCVGVLDLLEATGEFARVSVGSIVLGVAMGLLSGFLTKRFTRGRECAITVEQATELGRRPGLH
jgi:NhaP-type Na+/H+ or K+/H+ antiporter